MWHWLALVQRELLLFAGIFFLIGALDDMAVDLYWLWLKMTGRARTPVIDRADVATEELSGPAAVFIPAWHEALVIGDTIAHALSVWPQRELKLYVGCYANDPETFEAAMAAAPHDGRLRLVIHDCQGPSTKADCLNRLYRAMRDDELRTGREFSMVVFHDAEDMVDAAALPLLDRAIGQADFVQLPVLPLPQRRSRFFGSHYCEEFAESHGKSLVVRDALGAAIPAAGVGCAVVRAKLSQLALQHSNRMPFAVDSLTEDYELGLAIAGLGGTTRFLRVRDADGSLVATRAYFPATLEAVVKQKTRWVHGIALQGWDRIEWTRRPSEIWMRLRDRRGPITALVLLIAYGLLGLSAAAWIAGKLGYGQGVAIGWEIKLLLALNFFAFVWRALLRFGFTAREYGIAEGFRAMLRIPIANIIAIMAGRRALSAYLGTLAGQDIIWEKTTHEAHPARAQANEAVA